MSGLTFLLYICIVIIKEAKDIMTKIKTSYRELAENFYAKRDERSYNQLYQKVRPGLRNYIFNVVKDNEATEDILANTLVKLWTKIDKYDPQYQITTWLYKIAFNESLGYIRDRNRKYSLDSMRDHGIELTESTILSNSVADLIQDADAMTEADYLEEDSELMDRYTLALNCIKDLKPMYQEIVEDRLIRHMKYEDIAEKHGVPLQTIKNRIRRGKILIAEAMEE